MILGSDDDPKPNPYDEGKPNPFDPAKPNPHEASKPNPFATKPNPFALLAPAAVVVAVDRDASPILWWAGAAALAVNLYNLAKRAQAQKAAAAAPSVEPPPLVVVP